MWLKKFENLTPSMFSNFTMRRAFELSNQDTVSTGTLNNDNGNIYKTMVYRLNSNGTLIWQNCMKNNLGVGYLPAGALSFYVERVIDGLNGDVVLCGTTTLFPLPILKP